MTTEILLTCHDCEKDLLVLNKARATPVAEFFDSFEEAVTRCPYCEGNDLRLRYFVVGLRVVGE